MATFVKATSIAHVQWPLWPEAVSYELRSNHIILWWRYRRHGQVFCHGGQKCCPNLVLLSQARNNHNLAEVEGHVDHKFQGVLDEAGNCSSFVPMHTRPWGVFTSLRLKVFAAQGLGTNDAKWNFHWSNDQGASTRSSGTIFCHEAPSDSREGSLKMDEYIRADNSFVKEERKLTDTLRWQGASGEYFIQDMLEQSTTHAKVKTRKAIIKGSRVTHNQQGHTRIPSDHQPKRQKRT